MKKLYTLIFTSAFSVLAMNTNATTFNVTVGPSNTLTYSPNNITNVVVGDDIVFTLATGTHTVTSTSVPVGAAPLSSGTLSSSGTTSYTYHVTEAGTYNYHCQFHGSMTGSFTVSATGIPDPTVSLLTSVYPSPFKDKVTVKYNGIEKIEFMNVVGELVKTIDIDTQEGKLDVYFDNLPAGIYFYRTYKEGMVAETRKIVKGK